ncbi:MAG TPA: phosphate ABC transporter ATP-binding protein [Anaerolineae bacterium]|jgi:tungstate transport system ATP-binding protein|nr:phosphate ABC transporter ATP-binding protein [Anaerolineae bacterium]
MSEPIYTLNDVSQAYRGREVLRVDELQIGRGEILALVGPSGAGKSTLLRLLNFLETPASGVIRFQGACYGQGHKMPVGLQRRVTTVFQRPCLLNRSVAANVQYGLRLRGNRNSQRRVAEALEQVGLVSMAKDRARTLSGGEAQRVALARALVIEPDVLLLDEPTANLDPYNVGLIEQIIGHHNRERGTTVVLVTHNVFQAKRLAQRVALLLDGRIIEIGDVDRFFEAPGDPRTAAFIGGEMVY